MSLLMANKEKQDGSKVPGSIILWGDSYKEWSRKWSKVLLNCSKQVTGESILKDVTKMYFGIIYI